MSTAEFREAIHRQPENLRAAADAFAQAIAEVDIHTLGRGTVVLGGIGASGHALIPATRELRAAGRRAFAVSTSELGDHSAARLGDAFVMVSQSGASIETGDSPLARAADVWLPLGPLPDTPVATLSYTATLQALGMLCDALLGTPRRDSDWDRLPDLAGAVIERGNASAVLLAERFAEVRALDAVGGGPAHASAGETALLAREALRLAATGMETREYLHGPLEAVTAEFGCVLFGREREHGLAAALGSFGASVALISDTAPPEIDGVHVIELPEITRLAAPILQILPVQLLVHRTAQLRGLEIRDLTRHQHDTKVA
jgi:glucosamine--fructose-6-phosphate aminotransferase (isomerizing)